MSRVCEMFVQTTIGAGAAPRPARRAAPHRLHSTLMDLQIHPLVTMDALRGCETLQSRVWGYADREIVPAAQMRAALHAGALVAGAFVGRELVGFLYGFPAFAHEEGLQTSGLHSHMMAVLPEARGMGLGRRLKWFQRRWCLDRGIDWVSWTFDPLQVGNARLNLEHLGVVVHEYHVDFYGVLGGVLSGELPTDRFVALWHLDSPRVAGRAGDDPHAAFFRIDGDAPSGRVSATPGPAAAWALGRDSGRDVPLPPVTGIDAEAVWVAAPRDIGTLRRTSRDVAIAWGEAFRTVSLDLLERGYEARGFVAGAFWWVPRGEPS
jgi:predicted GNAT superfamily acetyltransferase